MGPFLNQFDAHTGYPDRGDYWLNAITVLNRMRFPVSLAENEVLGILVGDGHLKKLYENAAADTSREAALAAVTGVPDGRLVHTPGPARQSKPKESEGSAPMFVRDPGLALGSPEFQHK